MIKITTSLKKKLRAIRAVVVDVDGVLTDGGMYYSKKGEVMKKFNVYDGLGIHLLQKMGIKVAFVTWDGTGISKARAKKIGVEDVYENTSDKLSAVESFLKKYNIGFDEAAYIGDDLVDISPMEKVLLPVAVANAVDKVKMKTDIVLSKNGGEGAVREFAEILVKNKGISS